MTAGPYNYSYIFKYIIIGELYWVILSMRLKCQTVKEGRYKRVWCGHD